MVMSGRSFNLTTLLQGRLKGATRVFGSSYIHCILYYKVYNSSCSQVGHDLIDRVNFSPEQIKITASICKHILCDDGSASRSGKDASMQ